MKIKIDNTDIDGWRKVAKPYSNHNIEWQVFTTS